MEPETKSSPVPHPSFKEALRYWFKLGCISFGGPAGQISIMHQELVEKRRWISEDHFLHAINFCMLLPGPEAQQLATYLGWRLHGAKGGIAAGALFVLPSMLLLFGLSWLYMAGGELPWLKALFYGFLPAVIAIIASAVLRIGRKALKTPALWLIAAASFIAIFFFKISFVLIILLSAAIGWLAHRWWPTQFPSGNGQTGQDLHHAEAKVLRLPAIKPVTWQRTLTVTAVCLILWWLPMVLIASWLGWQSTPAQQGLFFSKAALVTFGGAYAVLPYVAQQAVENFSWLTHPQMMSGLALAETTPGPLIMVLQFVGFVGGWQQPGMLSPLMSATLGAFITTWVTFLPCFLFVFLGAPYVESLRKQPRLGATLTAITAAVVGVILNLGVGFTIHALWPLKDATAWGSIDGFVLVMTVIAFITMERFKLNLPLTIVLCGISGIFWQWA